jgi:hypothetical protein
VKWLTPYPIPRPAAEIASLISFLMLLVWPLWQETTISLNATFEESFTGNIHETCIL